MFDEESALDPVAIRQAIFLRATALRRTRDELRPFDRDAVVREIAASMGQPPEALERALFADLRGEHVLQSAPVLNAASIVDAYELGRAQAILLRAVRVRCEVKSGAPAAVRAFFALLKFQRLLFTAERGESGGFTITIDGPFSMFESVTKYGLRLALVLPALRMLEGWSLVADVRWGKERTPLTFRMSSSDGPAKPAGVREATDDLSDDVRSLLAGIKALPKTRWTAEGREGRSSITRASGSASRTSCCAETICPSRSTSRSSASGAATRCGGASSSHSKASARASSSAPAPGSASAPR